MTNRVAVPLASDIDSFDNPTHATPEGIVAIGHDLRPETLIRAYSHGVFPWPIDEDLLPWFCPPRRAILETHCFHISSSMRRSLNQFHTLTKTGIATLSIDQHFSEVIETCSNIPRPGQESTWILPDIKRAYFKLFELGIAHSFEITLNGKLVAGLYGVEVKGVFSGESMFHTVSNASKWILCEIMKRAKERGIDWIDIQVLTPHMKAMGAREITRAQFLKRLTLLQNQKLTLF